MLNEIIACMVYDLQDMINHVKYCYIKLAKEITCLHVFIKI